LTINSFEQSKRLISKYALKLYSLIQSADFFIFTNSEINYTLNYLIVKRVE
jgi:hypothetical protein